MKYIWCLSVALCTCCSVAQAGTASGDLLSEDFDGLVLSPNIEDNSVPLGTPNQYTKNPPADWSIDNSSLGGVPLSDGDEIPGNNGGVEEWEGWSFAAKSFFEANAQGRTNFTRGSGVVAVAEPDDYDDSGDPLHEGGPTYNTLLTTRAISLTGIAAGTTLYVSFDSSFRGENGDEAGENQTAIVTANFSFGFVEPQELLHYASDPLDSNFLPGVHSDDPLVNPAINEEVMLSFVVPELDEGLENVSLTFSLLNALNDWWWAIDNLKVGTSFTSEGPTGDYNGDGQVNAADYTVWRNTRGSTTDLVADGNESGTVEIGDYNFWRARFGSGAGISAAVPEPNSVYVSLSALVAIFAFRHGMLEPRIRS